MAEFLLPKNSKISRKGRVHRAEGAKRIKSFRIYGGTLRAARTRATTPSRSISTTAGRWSSTR